MVKISKILTKLNNKFAIKHSAPLASHTITLNVLSKRRYSTAGGTQDNKINPVVVYSNINYSVGSALQKKIISFL
jgi:hypothetical protein